MVYIVLFVYFLRKNVFKKINSNKQLFRKKNKIALNLTVVANAGNSTVYLWQPILYDASAYSADFSRDWLR